MRFLRRGIILCGAGVIVAAACAASGAGLAAHERVRAFGALPSWQGVWYIDDGIFDRIGPGPNRPEGPGPDIFDRKLSQHPPYNVDWEARYQGLE